MPYQILRFALIVAAAWTASATLHAEDAAFHIASAKKHIANHKFDKAFADCNKAIELDFNSADAYNTRARARIGMAGGGESIGTKQFADNPKTLDDCDEALAIDPNFADAYVNRASAWLLEGEFKKAVDDCNKALDIDRKCARAYSTRAQARVFTGEDDKVIADSDRALALDSKLADAYESRGSAWVDKGEYEKGLVDCEKALTLDPGMAVAYVNIGLVWAHRGEQKKAIAEYQRALSITPDSWKALNDLGVARWQQAEVQDKMAATAEAAGDQKTAAACHRKSAALKDQAKAYWKHGIAVRPTATDILNNLGYAYSAANDLDRAESYLKSAVALQPTQSRPHNNLGRIQLRRSYLKEIDARAAESKSKSDPDQAAYANRLWDESRALRGNAIAQFKKAIELNPTLLEARLNLGQVYLTMKELDKAEEQYRAILKLEGGKGLEWDANDNFSQAYAELGWIAIARKKHSEATDYLQQAMRLNPRNAPALQLLTHERYSMGEYIPGEKNLATLLAMYPAVKRHSVVEQLAKELRADGKDEAAKRLEEYERKK